MKGSWRYTTTALELLQIYFPRSLYKTLAIPIAHLACMVCYLMIIAMQFSKIEDISDWVQNFHAFCAFLQVLLKFIILWNKKQQYTNLLIQNEIFWDTTLSLEDNRGQLDAILRYVLTFQKVFCLSIIFTVTVVIAASFMQGNIPVGVWKTTQYQHLFYPAGFVGVCALAYASWTVCAVDALFLVFCVHLGVQFRILSDCFAQLQFSDEVEYKSDLKKFVQQHDFLLRFQKDFEKFYSPILAVQYLSIAPLVCVHMYYILEGEHISIVFSSFFTLVSEMFQMSMYCIPAEILINMASDVSFGIYNCGWPSSRIAKTSNTLVFITQRSQHPMAFLGAGMFDVRAATLLTVMKASYSICTVMRGLKDK